MTARNYLFAQNQDDVALTRFIATAAQATGFLKGAPGGHLPGWYRTGADNDAFLRTLRARLAESYPWAGEPFYAVRLWTNLIWQPAYLAVLAAHVHGAMPDLRLLSQSRQNLDVDGYRLESAPQVRGTTEELIALAGPQLRGMADTLLVEINGITRLKRLPALRLLADRMLSLMVTLPRFVPGTDVAAQQRYCDLWFAALGIEGHGALERLRLSTGHEVMISARKGCCLDYLAFPDTYCSNCPKLDKAERIARQRRVAEDELAAAQ